MWFFASILISSIASAYPEYSARFNSVTCTACHMSPVGGGPRNSYGKLFGAHGYKMNQSLVQEYASADLRALYYFPEKSNTTKGGMGVMAGSVAVHAPLDESKKINLVIEHNVAGFSSATYRDTYALFKFGDQQKSNWVESLLVGRFRVPFGIISDEHRTYTKIQSATEWFTMDVGAIVSGTPHDKVHYDLAIINGEKSYGEALNIGQANRWGAVFNARWMPGPFFVGASASYYQHDPENLSKSATSAYAVVSLSRWTRNRVPLEIILEHSQATGWNSNLNRGFISDSVYAQVVDRSTSYGWLSYLRWELSEHLWLIYKYDLLTPNISYPADHYERHGLGVKWVVGPNVIVQARTELARATHPSERSSVGSGAQDASYAILQLSF